MCDPPFHTLYACFLCILTEALMAYCDCADLNTIAGGKVDLLKEVSALY